MSKDDGRWSGVIRVGIREKFFAEEKPGTLVNNLLDLHYEQAEHFKNDLVKVTWEPSKEKIIKTSADVIKKLPKPTTGSKLCKHGNPKGSCFDKQATRMGCNR